MRTDGVVELLWRLGGEIMPCSQSLRFLEALCIIEESTYPPSTRVEDKHQTIDQNACLLT